MNKIKVVSSVPQADPKTGVFLLCTMSNGSLWTYHPSSGEWNQVVPSFDELTVSFKETVKNELESKKK